MHDCPLLHLGEAQIIKVKVKGIDQAADHQRQQQDVVLKAQIIAVGHLDQARQKANQNTGGDQAGGQAHPKLGHDIGAGCPPSFSIDQGMQRINQAHGLLGQEDGGRAQQQRREDGCCTNTQQDAHASEHDPGGAPWVLHAHLKFKAGNGLGVIAWFGGCCSHGELVFLKRAFIDDAAGNFILDIGRIRLHNGAVMLAKRLAALTQQTHLPPQSSPVLRAIELGSGFTALRHGTDTQTLQDLARNRAFKLIAVEMGEGIDSVCGGKAGDHGLIVYQEIR